MYRISKTVRQTHGADGAVVLDIRQGQIFNLNLVGSRVLDLVGREVPVEEIVDEIVREFGVNHQLAESDVHTFLQTLTNYCLVERSCRE